MAPGSSSSSAGSSSTEGASHLAAIAPLRPTSGWVSVILVTLMLLTVAWSIQAADYAPGLDILTPIVILGVLAAVVLAGLVWMPATVAHGWSLLLGMLVTGVLATNVLPHHMPTSELALLGMSERLSLVRDWYMQWLAGAAGGGAPADRLVPFAFVVTMAALLWLLSYICTWFVVRYVSWWGAVLPSGFALLFNLYQAPEERLKGMAFFLLCALLLAQQMHVTIQLDRWRRERVHFSPGIGFDLLRDGVVVAVVVIAMGWLAPASLSSEGLASAARRFSSSSQRVQEQLNRLFPDLNYPIRGGGSAFGESMPLGGSISLGQKAIFDASVEGAVLTPRYFRMAVYDTYDGAGWRRSPEASASFEPMESATSGPYELTVPVTQTIRTFVPGARQLYSMPQPAAFSVATRAEVATADGSYDVLAVESERPLSVGDQYIVVSDQTVADVSTLGHVAGTDPDWVRARYLQLPDSLPDSVTELAQQITAGADNRYDKASMIEAFLRGYEYSEEIDDPPSDRDRVDWFLFDERRGYCDYFSTAFVVMARSVGVPARLAAGYSAGEFVKEAGAYRQHEYDAHTWPEVFFPGLGWVEFEPTAADAPLSRPPTSADVPADVDRERPRPDRPFDDMLPDDEVAQAIEMPEATTAPSGSSPFDWHLLLYALGLVVLSGAAFAATYAVWERPLRGLSPAEGAFARLARVAAWMGLRQHETDTPYEYGDRLAGAIPEGREDIATIVDAYVNERFGQRRTEHGEGRVSAAWQRIRRLLPSAAAQRALRRVRDRRR